MTKEEFNVFLTSAANPDTAPAALASIQEGFNELFTNNESLTANLTTKDNQIADLRDTNMKLFLRTTQQVNTDSPAATTDTEFVTNTFLKGDK